MSYFTPSAARARDCRRAMAVALVDSAVGLLADRLPQLPGSHAPVLAGAVRPLDYGAYFDLALPVALDPDAVAAVRSEASAYLLQRLSGMGDAAPIGGPTTPLHVTTLSSQYYPPAAIARFRRWWDTEPANAMNLTGVSDEALAAAQLSIVEALTQLRRAAPELHAELVVIVNEVVIARPDGAHRMDFGGATSFALWGAMAINADAHASWLHYYQTLVHEAAHGLLFALARNEPLVLGDSGEKFGSPLRDDLRPMDGIFHAAFVSARESLALDLLLCRHERDDCLTAEEADLTAGLLEGSVLAFWDCVATLSGQGRLSGLGEAILRECEAFMVRNFAIESVAD